MVLTTGCQLDIAPSSEPQYAELMVSSLFSTHSEPDGGSVQHFVFSLIFSTLFELCFT